MVERIPYHRETLLSARLYSTFLFAVLLGTTSPLDTAVGSSWPLSSHKKSGERRSPFFQEDLSGFPPIYCHLANELALRVGSRQHRYFYNSPPSLKVPIQCHNIFSVSCLSGREEIHWSQQCAPTHPCRTIRLFFVKVEPSWDFWWLPSFFSLRSSFI